MLASVTGVSTLMHAPESGYTVRHALHSALVMVGKLCQLFNTEGSVLILHFRFVISPSYSALRLVTKGEEG